MVAWDLVDSVCVIYVVVTTREMIHHHGASLWGAVCVKTSNLVDVHFTSRCAVSWR